MESQLTISRPTAWSRWRYYLNSLLTLFGGVTSRGSVISLVLGRPAVIMLRGGLTFKVRSLMDLWIIKETCLDRDYESFGVHLEDGWNVIDIGAGLGDFAISVGRRFPGSRIVAFEPFAESFGLLQENMGLNRIKNVTAVPAAVAAERGQLQLAQTGAAVQHTTQAASSRSTTPVPAEGLAESLIKFGFDRVDFLKVDCEGGEFDILLNTPADTLHKINHIALEYHDRATPHHHQEIVDHLISAGFTVTTRPSPVHADLGLLFAKLIIDN